MHTSVFVFFAGLDLKMSVCRQTIIRSAKLFRKQASHIPVLMVFGDDYYQVSFESHWAFGAAAIAYCVKLYP